MAAVKGVAADAVADYLRSADVYQVTMMPLLHAFLDIAMSEVDVVRCLK